MKNFVLPIEKFNGNLDDLKKARTTEVAILKTFIKYCEEFTINYFLFGDALNGAIKNKNFLEDKEGIDILMTRPDYEKFVSCFIKVPIIDMQLSSLANDESCLVPYSTLKKNGTEMAGSGKYNNGVYITVYPLDGMPIRTLSQKMRFDKVNRLLAIMNINKMKEYEPNATFMRKVQLLLLKCYSIIKKPRRWKLAFEAEIKRCSYKYSQFVVCLNNGTMANVLSKDKFVNGAQVNKTTFAGLTCTIPFSFNDVINAYDAEAVVPAPVEQAAVAEVGEVTEQAVEKKSESVVSEPKVEKAEKVVKPAKKKVIKAKEEYTLSIPEDENEEINKTSDDKE